MFVRTAALECVNQLEMKTNSSKKLSALVCGGRGCSSFFSWSMIAGGQSAMYLLKDHPWMVSTPSTNCE